MDRARRYESASALGADIERQLRCEPVLAGPPGAAHRLSKLVRRHRLAFAAGAAVAAALLLGVIGTTWGLVRAAAEGREAKRHALGALGRHAEGEPHLVAAAAAMRESEGPTRAAWDDVAEFYEAWARLQGGSHASAQAARWRERLASFQG
jgi:hypothetical protein